MVRRVAVIGAGSGGLVSIKCCLDEGQEPVCFESSDDIGGLWRFKERPEPEHSSIYRSLVSNTSKEMMCFSDFPMPADYPNYLHNAQLLQYYQLYAQHFDLLKYIQFQTTVRSVRQRPDLSYSGQWEVVTENRDGLEESHVFDGVLVSSGHYTHPVTPMDNIKGAKTFPGKYYHSWEYKDPEPFRGKRVVIVGIGNSGCDIAVEISRTAEKTFLSTRKGGWILGRMSDKGLPLDMLMINRRSLLMQRLLPKALLNWVTERRLNNKYDHRLYSLQPKHRFFDRRPIVNDDLPGRILYGALAMKSNMLEFRGSSVVFEDQSVEENIDAVVFCTGYSPTFSFLPSSLVTGRQGEIRLYKHMFPPSLERPTLALLGLIQTSGPIMPCMELQARWATRAIAGLSQLPSEKKMNEVIDAEMQRYTESYPSHATVQVQYIPYLDDLAQEVGARPNFLSLLFRDPSLSLKVLLGPCTPYQFRLFGPGQWKGARQAICTQWDRVTQPMRTRPVPRLNPSSMPGWWLALSSGLTVVLAILAFQIKLPDLFDNLSEAFGGVLDDLWKDGIAPVV
ncbi:dimethylaniline monooxygenase [N-oxide-forming] 2-like [Alosa sapidissima]|uniref:dimethylaniline monooxygenase [N-oxide-forming] 2-like n=1 Tax=Alosa sapidissima TaxID=34773 RepID=UPI001C08CC46|nr:dimethylaniline monooxygenase [N-oxide-forming] 2-like [Alosa sapidissima]XP_041967777.1 dimethylaniline monooxygenase [N-oxide-forming] 2-like [Alosa sapidissima]